MADRTDDGVAALTPLIFIHDAAIDDFVATLLLLGMPQYDLWGVVIANADCIPQAGIDVASRVAQFMGQPNLPIGLSAARGWNPFPWPYRGDCVRLAAIPSLAPFRSTVPTPPPSGDEVLAGLLYKASQAKTPVTILLTTGFTPLMAVLDQQPELEAAIGQVAWMGGALDVPGNLDPKTIDPSVANTTAEWNVFWDPFAADRALGRLRDVKVFPLDITNTASITAQLMAQLQRQGAAGDSFSQFAFEAYGLVSDEPFYDMWNVTSAVWLDAPQVYAAPETTALQVTQWGFEQGQLLRAPSGSKRPPQEAYLSFADRAGFYSYVAKGLARSS